MRPGNPPAKAFSARYWSQMADGKILCELCPRYCKVKPGQRGFCYVRQGTEDGMVLTTYGRSSGFCIDPIEKKPLNHFYPGTAILSFGTAGCNLGCKFCQNWDISKSRDQDILAANATPEAIAQKALSEKCQSVAFTYNDPVIFAEYAIDTARACRDVGVKTVAVSAGYITAKARADFFQYIDAANIDLKGFSESFYQKICYGKLDPVLETLTYLHRETDVWLEITHLVIPQENDSEDEIRALAHWIANELSPFVPLHLTAFHPDFRLRNRPATPVETLQKARQLALSEGLAFVYLGNVHQPELSTTYCQNCQATLIERDWFELGTYALTPDSRCLNCGEKIPGVFGTHKGTWRGRKPIAI